SGECLVSGSLFSLFSPFFSTRLSLSSLVSVPHLSQGLFMGSRRDRTFTLQIVTICLSSLTLPSSLSLFPRSLSPFLFPHLPPYLSRPVAAPSLSSSSPPAYPLSLFPPLISP